MSSSTSSFRSYIATLLTLVVAASLAGLAATEWLVRTQVEPNDQLPAHLRLFHSAKERDVGLGDSHMACGFYPPQGMVNLAFPGENIETIAYKARAYFRTSPPHRVIVQAEPHMFARYRAGPTRGYNEAFDRPPNEQSGEWLRILTSYHRPKLFAYWKVWWGKGSFDSRTKLAPNGWTACAGQWKVEPPETRRSLARARARLHEPAEDFARSEFASAYRRLLEELVQKGARVCLVEFPVTPEYRTESAGESYLAARAWFGVQARQLGIRYVEDAAIYSDRIDLFSDMDHLSAEGAREFSRTMIRECFE